MSALRLCCVLILVASAACEASEEAVASMADGMMGAAAAGVGGTGSAGGAGGSSGGGAAATGGGSSRDPCLMMTPRTDISGLGDLAQCVPQGVALACRTESPAYACSDAPSSDLSARNGCRNTADCAVLDAIRAQAAAMTGPGTSNIVRECGLPLLAQSDCGVITEGATECVMEETSMVLAPGLSAPCAGCFTTTLLCNLKCLQHCSLDAESAPCVACMHIEGCRGLFYQCSGLEPVE